MFRHLKQACPVPDRRSGYASRPNSGEHFHVNENKEKSVAEAEVATDRMQKSLRVAKSIVRDYRAKLCSRSAGEQDKGLFRFER